MKKRPGYLQKNKYWGYNKEFINFAQKKLVKPMTNTQARFASFLLRPDIYKKITVIGDMESIFEAVRQYNRIK